MIFFPFSSQNVDKIYFEVFFSDIINTFSSAITYFSFSGVSPPLASRISFLKAGDFSRYLIACLGVFFGEMPVPAARGEVMEG